MLIQISEEQKERALRLYRNKNLTMNEIANLCDFSTSYLRLLVKHAVEAGLVRPRDESMMGRSNKPKFTNEQLEQIAVDYYKNKMSVFEIFEKWGIHPMQLQRVRKKFGDRYDKKVMGGEFRVRPIQQFDKEGNLIAEFANGHQASEKTGINYQTINRSCNGVYKSAGGYVWKFKECINE